MTRVKIRELSGPEEFLATMAVSKAAWGFHDRSVSPASDLIAASEAGGLTAAAFEGRKMLGFVHGFPRTNLAEPAQYSHLLAVLPEAQGRGLSVALKQFQRSWCLAHGIRLVTWMYDPFLVKNATLNLMRLGSSADRFHPNLYGFIGGIYADIPSDRFEAFWRLESPRAVDAAEGKSAKAPDLEDLPVAKSARSLPDAPRVVVPFLGGAPKVFRTDPSGSRRARRAFGAVARALLEKGYVATDVVARPEGPAYVFTKRPEG